MAGLRSRLGVCCLCLALLCTPSWVSAQSGKSEQQQQPKQDSSSKPSSSTSKSSTIIPSAGETTLVNGIGDVKPDGACKADVKALCKDVSPGDDRLLLCLVKRIKQAQQGNVAGRSVSDKCQQDVANYRMERSKHINRDVALARACKDDAEKLCKSAKDSTTPGSVLQCLRSSSKKVSAACKGELWRTQAEVAEDYRTDPQLYDNCKDSVQQLCQDVEPGNGAELDCLIKHSKALDWSCMGNVLRVAKVSAVDIRLNMKLYKACATDWKKFCKDVEPGHMRVQECLEDHIEKSGFSNTCKTTLEEVIAQRVADFRIDAGLQEACEEDLVSTCSTSLKEMEEDEPKRSSALKCLQQFRDELHSQACRDQVHRKMSRASRDIRFDEILANACQDDRKQYCNDVQPGSARVIRCLQDHRRSLTSTCAAALFDHEVKMAEDIDFKYPTRRACAWEISHFCKGVPHGHARIIRCLQNSLEEQDMSAECKTEVMKDQNRMAQDYRLNWRLNTACTSDIKRLCGGLCDTSSGQPCGGVVLQCLQDKQDNITSSACQEEVFYYQLMEVTDFRNDVILAEACRTDVEKFCKDVEPGEGRVHTCLRFNLKFLTERCAAEENKLAAVEFKDIRLRPKLAKVCSEERAVYCKDVKPGKARVIKCLMENMAQPNFGEECRAELAKRQHVVKNDYRYDIGVLTHCGSDVDRLCADAKGKVHGNATVLKCLVDNFSQTADACQSEMSRAVRFALWDYQEGQGPDRKSVV